MKKRGFFYEERTCCRIVCEKDICMLKKMIVFWCILVVFIIVVVECGLRIIDSSKNFMRAKVTREWQLTDTEAELMRIHNMQRKNVHNFGTSVRFSKDLYMLDEHNNYYVPLPHQSIAIVRNERVGHFALPYNAEIKSLLADFQGEVYIRNYDELSMRKTYIDDERELPKPSVTVLNLGDSFTGGTYVNDEDTFSSYMERYTIDADDPVAINVINAGISGYNTREHYFRLMDILRDRDSIDIVVLHFFANDTGIVEHKLIGNWKPKEPQSKVGIWLFDHFLLAEILMDAYFSICAVPANPEKNNYLQEQWQTCFGFLEKMNSECQKRNIRFMIAAIPSKEQFLFGVKINYQDKLREFCGEHDIIFLDPYEYLEENGGGTLYLDWDPHFRKEGHKIYGRFMYEYLSAYVAGG